MKKIIITTIILSLVTFNTYSFSSEVDSQNWFKIELIIFEHSNHLKKEVANPLRYLKLNDSYLTENYINNDYYQSLSQNDLELIPIEKKLNNNHNKMLFHNAWKQNLMIKKNAISVRIQGGEKLDALPGMTELDGTFKVSLNRYLHVDTDLQFIDHSADEPLSYSLIDSRRAKSGEIHYIDHPAFGVIFKITPLEPI